MKKLLIILSCFIFILGCKKPTENLKLNVEPALIKYLAIVNIKDMGSNEPATGDLTISFTGRDADYIYSTDGTKKFKVVNGQIEIGLHPDREPQITGDTVKFGIAIGSPNHIPTNVEVNFVKDQFIQRVRVYVLNIIKPPKGITIAKRIIQLNEGTTGLPSTIKAKTTADSVYYDDGQTTVVLPQGTNFYYYQYEQTGTAEGVKKEPVWKEKTHTETVNGEPREVTERVLGYYETEKYTYPTYAYVKKKYTGNAIDLYCAYTSGDISYSVSFDQPYPSYYNNQMIRLYNNGLCPLNEALYKSAIQKRLYNLYFIGKIKDQTGKDIYITLSPDTESKWFISYVLNRTTINPVTNQPIKAGDSIEVSIDLENSTTRREEIQEINNELRIQTANIEAGYYYKAPYIYPFNYSFTSSYNVEELPDPENAFAILNTNVFSTYVYPDNSSAIYNGKICSAFPITPDGSLEVYYWNKKVKNEVYSSFNVSSNVFYGMQSLGDKSVWNFKIVCETKQYVPDYTGIVNYDNGNFNAVVRGGIWTTRGLSLGRQYNFSGMGYSPRGRLIQVKRNYPVNSYNEITEWLDGGGKSLCDEF